MAKTKTVREAAAPSRKEQREKSKAVHIGRVYHSTRKLSNALLRSRLGDLVAGGEYL